MVEGSTQSSFRNVNQSNPKENIKDRRTETDPNVQVLPADRARDDPGEGTARGTHVCKQVSFNTFILFSLLKTGGILMLIMLDIGVTDFFLTIIVF